MPTCALAEVSVYRGKAKMKSYVIHSNIKLPSCRVHDISTQRLTYAVQETSMHEWAEKQSRMLIHSGIIVSSLLGNINSFNYLRRIALPFKKRTNSGNLQIA